MKIAIVTPYDWGVPGGVNVHVANHADEMRSRGHEVRIIAPGDVSEPGVVTVGRTVAIPFNGSVARLAFGPRVDARVRIALRRARPDLVHIHEPFSPSASLLALRSARVPVVATFHAAIESRLYRVAGRVGLRRLWRRIAASIAVSPSAQASVEAVFGPGPIIIPNGVRCAEFGAVGPVDPDRRTVLFLGRLERRKGPQVLLGAAPAILRAVPRSRIVFAGDGPLHSDLAAAVPTEFAERIAFQGRFSDAARAALLGDASVVALPALGGESFGITLAESLAAGRPVVASAIEGYAAVARADVDAVLVPPGEVDALAEAVIGLLKDSARARELGDRARVRAATFDWPAVAERIEAVYTEVLARSPGRAK